MMREFLLGLALTMVGVGCGAADGATSDQGESASTDKQAIEQKAPVKICPAWGCNGPPKGCDEATCSAAGGSCSGVGAFSTCSPGCETAPGSCTAVVAYPEGSTETGFIAVNCTGIGNGNYTISFTTAPAVCYGGLEGCVAPDGPWTPYNNYGPGAELFPISGGPVVLSADENDEYLPGCNPAYYNANQCTMHATYVQVCAQPGTAPYTEQSGLCGNLESFPQQCQTVAVTYQ